MLLATLDVLTVRSHLFGSDPVVELLLGSNVLPENVATEVVRELANVVRGVLLGRDREDLVELFERERLRLGHEEPHGDGSDDVPPGVPTERSLRLERTEETRERESDDEVAVGCEKSQNSGKVLTRNKNSQSPGRRGSERHSDVTNVERERLGRVGEG